MSNLSIGEFFMFCLDFYVQKTFSKTSKIDWAGFRGLQLKILGPMDFDFLYFLGIKWLYIYVYITPMVQELNLESFCSMNWIFPSV